MPSTNRGAERACEPGEDWAMTHVRTPADGWTVDGFVYRLDVSSLHMYVVRNNSSGLCEWFAESASHGQPAHIVGGYIDASTAKIAAEDYARSEVADMARAFEMPDHAAALEEAIVALVKAAHAADAEHERLRWGVVANAGRTSPIENPRWVHVKTATGLGRTAAKALCKSAGYDPDEMVSCVGTSRAQDRRKE